jgi:hypothetical protein
MSPTKSDHRHLRPAGYEYTALAPSGPLRSLRRVRRDFYRLDDRGIIVLGLVDPRRDRPHPHRSGREWMHQLARVGLLAEPAGIVARRENDRHAVMNVGHELVGVGGDDCERPNPFARRRLFPVLPNPGKPERRAVLHGDRVGLLRLLALDRLPFEEPVHRHDAAAHSVGTPERGQIPHALALGVDRLSAALGITAPIRDQAPPQRIERYLAGPVIAADDQQVLARRAVPPRRIVVHAAVAHVHAIDDGIAKRSAALDDPPAHGAGYSRPTACVPARYLPIDAPDVGFAPDGSMMTSDYLSGARDFDSLKSD